MSNIVLVAETGSDVPKDIAKKYGIYIVPMHVSFGEETLDDGSFPVEKIFNYYEETGQVPKTSASSPPDFQKTFDEIHERWPEKQILYLAYSAVTTCSYQNAMLAATDRSYVTSVDTKQVSGGQAAVVIAMAQLLEEKPELSLADAVEAANRFCREVRMCFLPDDLAYLRAGGRVNNATYLGSRLFHVHPAIEVIDGILLATMKYRGRLIKVAPRLIREYTQTHQFSKERIYLLWAVGLGEDVKQVAEAEARQCGFQEIIWLKAGCVITTHGGPGAFGLAAFAKEKAV